MKRPSTSQWLLFLLITVIFISWATAHNGRNAVKDKNVRIAIIGGGVSGLSSALWLKQKGYNHITLLEKEAQLGGKVQSFVHPNGRAYEVGAVAQSDDFKNIYDMVRITGYADNNEAWLSPYPRNAVVIDKRGNPISSAVLYLSPKDYKQSLSNRYSRFEEVKSFMPFSALKYVSNRTTNLPGFEDLLELSKKDEEYKKLYLSLLEPMDKFISEVELPNERLPRNLHSIFGPFKLFYNLTGYGFTSEVPAIYHMKLFDINFNFAKRQLTFQHPLTKAKNGYQLLFRHVGEYLKSRGVDIHLSTEVQNVKRPTNTVWGSLNPNAEQVQITYKDIRGLQTSDFDIVIVATPPDSVVKYLDVEEESKQFFSEVKYYNFVTTIFEDRNNSLRKYRNSTVFVEDYILDARGAINNTHVIGFYNLDGSQVFTAYSYVPTPDSRWVTDNEIQLQLIKDFKKMGADIIKDSILLTKQWRNYFPHFSSTTLKSDNARFLPKMLSLQGRRQTLYFESTEHLAAYSRRLVDEFFE
jgi:protoporphyrinogen oxidase